MKAILAVLMMAVGLFAQEQPKPPMPKLVELKNINAQGIVNSRLFGSLPISINVDPTGRYLVLSGSPEIVTAVESAIQRLDVPVKNVELTFHIISASPQAVPDKLPADLEAVVKQLRNTFTYAGYRLLETALMRVRDGEGGDLSSQLPGNALYQIRCKPVRVAQGTPNLIRIDNLRFGGRFPVANAKGDTSYVETNTDIDVKEGQKVVVGKSTMGDSAAFLVVAARVLD